METNIKKEYAYHINNQILLYQAYTDDGIEYTIFDAQTKKKIDGGVLPKEKLVDNPVCNAIQCAVIVGDVCSIAQVSLLMLESFKESGIHSRQIWNPETLPSEDIRFIDSHYNDLFKLPNGGFIQVDYPDETVIKKCTAIGSHHTKVGYNTFHIREFAECMEKRGATYQPEPEIMGDEAAWKLGKDKYLAIRFSDADECYYFSLLNENSEVLDGGVLERTDLSMLEARANILELLDLSPLELRAMVYEDLMKQNLAENQNMCNNKKEDI